MPPVPGTTIDIAQYCVWPGCLGILSAQYTVSHGITPGRFQIITIPQISAPQEFGDLIFCDGLNEPITIPNCHATIMTGRASPQGQEYIIEGEDERWMWRFGAINGHYNATDQRQKLVPWTIQSPQEMATILIEEFWDGPFDVSQLPVGLDSSVGADLNRWLVLGETLPQSLTNPETIWDYTTPAEALERLVNLYGCRTVYQPIARQITICKVGVGEDLPDGPLGLELDAPTVSTTGAAPESLNVAGAPVRIQARFALEMVGEEWNGAIMPANLLSYAPKGQVQSQTSTLSNWSGTGGQTLCASIQFTDPLTGNQITITASSTTPGQTPFQRMQTIINTFLANPVFAANFQVTYTVISNFYTLTAPFSFNFQVFNCPADTSVLVYDTNDNVQFQNLDNLWSNCLPPMFMGVQATDRLSVDEARALAAKHIWRSYRIMNVDPATGEEPLELPWWGEIVRRQQIVLQDRKVALIIPSPRIPGGQNKVGQGGVMVETPPPDGSPIGILPEFYNGYAREQSATIRGSVSRQIGTVLWFPQGVAENTFTTVTANTADTDRVFVPFSIVPIEQMVTFTDHVYYDALGAGPNTIWLEPELTLETACLVIDDRTNQIIRAQVTSQFGGVAPPYWEIHEDVCQDVVGLYDADNNLQNPAFTIPDQADANARAQYYLNAEAIPFQLKTGRTREYIGLIGIDPDGLIQQVTYSVGNGATTKASSNSEHSPVIAPYSVRRRAENLPPWVAAKAAQNVDAYLKSKLPNPSAPTNPYPGYIANNPNL